MRFLSVLIVIFQSQELFNSYSQYFERSQDHVVAINFTRGGACGSFSALRRGLSLAWGSVVLIILVLLLVILIFAGVIVRPLICLLLLALLFTTLLRIVGRVPAYLALEFSLV